MVCVWKLICPKKVFPRVVMCSMELFGVSNSLSKVHIWNVHTAPVCTRKDYQHFSYIWKVGKIVSDNPCKGFWHVRPASEHCEREDLSDSLVRLPGAHHPLHAPASQAGSLIVHSIGRRKHTPSKKTFSSAINCTRQAALLMVSLRSCLTPGLTHSLSSPRQVRSKAETIFFSELTSRCASCWSEGRTGTRCSCSWSLPTATLHSLLPWFNSWYFSCLLHAKMSCCLKLGI